METDNWVDDNSPHAHGRGPWSYPSTNPYRHVCSMDDGWWIASWQSGWHKLAGPYPSLEVVKVAYLLLYGE